MYAAPPAQLEPEHPGPQPQPQFNLRRSREGERLLRLDIIRLLREGTLSTKEIAESLHVKIRKVQTVRRSFFSRGCDTKATLRYHSRRPRGRKRKLDDRVSGELLRVQERRGDATYQQLSRIIERRFGIRASCRFKFISMWNTRQCSIQYHGFTTLYTVVKLHTVGQVY
jgi:transposase